MNRTLMRAIVKSAVFAGLSEDDVVQPDVAVAYLEQLAAILKELTPVEQMIFVKYVEDMVATERRNSSPKERIDFLSLLAENLGLKEILEG